MLYIMHSHLIFILKPSLISLENAFFHYVLLAFQNMHLEVLEFHLGN